MTRDGHGIDSPHPWVVVCHPLILALVIQTESGEGLSYGTRMWREYGWNGIYWILDKGLYGFVFL